MKFRLEIELGNDAMQTKEDISAALIQAAARMPRCIIGNLEVHDNAGIFDANGNRVGFWEVVEE